MELVSLL